jgi:hypothetical protein
LRQFVQRTGVGGQADFNALISADPHFASAWGDIQTQLVTEGVTDFTGAQQAFTDSFQQLASQSFGLSLDTGTVGNAYATAKQYVMTGQTIAGAVSTVTGLIGSIESNTMQPLAVMQTFTGTMLGLLAVAGVPTAGIGAAIVGAIGVGIAVIQQLTGSPPQPQIIGYTNCGYILNEQPNWIAGCLGAWGIVNSPDTNDWRPIPEPSNPADAVWFQSGQVGPGQWCVPIQGGSDCSFFGIRGNGKDQGYNSPGSTYAWGPPVNGVNPAGGDTSQRPIDNAFPGASQLNNTAIGTGTTSIYAAVVEQGAGLSQIDTTGWDPTWIASLQDFTKAYVAAWKANASYVLNGLAAQPDYVVLAHLLRMWNKSHVGPTWSLLPSNTSYLGGVVAAGFHASQFADLALNGGLKLNLGVMRQPVGPSGINKAVVGSALIVGAAGAGLFAYAHLNDIAFTTAAQRLWGTIASWFGRRHILAHENPGDPRRVAFRVHLNSHNVVVLRPDNTAILYKYGERIADFIPAKYQLTKIRAGRGDILIYSDQLLGI